ncbi:MAG: hypothetical protein KJO07_04720 [Deltaproteobacteria bacterium]|nr:hypothetical protein [Deltaproteobacteria bacterium]
MKVASVVSVVLVALLGCDEPLPIIGKSKEAGPAVIDASVKLADAGPSEPLFTEKPLAEQLSEEPMASVEFIGWSRGGDLYVIDSKRGFEGGELSGSRAIELREVRDSRSHELLHSFRIEKNIDAQVEKDDRLRRAWTQAKPMKAYRAFAKEHPVVQDATSPEGVALSLRVVPKSVPVLSKVTARSAGLTQVIEWRSWETPKNAKEKRAKKARDKLDTSTMRPAVELLSVTGKESRVVDRISADYNVGLISEATNNPADDTIVSGAVAWHWSPDGKRVLYTVNWTTRGLNPEMVQPLGVVRVRSTGPQVTLTISKDERARASKLVRDLEAQGVTITEVGFSIFQPPVTSSVSYGDDRDRKAAESVATAIAAKAGKNPLKGWDIGAVIAPQRGYVPTP